MMSAGGLQNTVDAPIAHLNDALNETTMKALLSDCLEKTEDHIQIVDCKLIRFRVRPLKRAIVLYEIETLSPFTQNSCKHWVTGTLYEDPKRTRKRFMKMNSTASDDSRAADALYPLPNLVHLEKINMILEVFPFDRYLPTLDAVLKQPEPKLVNKMLMAACPDNDNDLSQYTDWTAKPTRYRPHLGVTFKITHSTKSGPPNADITQYLKVLRDGEASVAFEHLETLHNNNQPNQYFSLVKPLACINKINAVLLEESPGVPFDQLLRENKKVIENVQRVAKGLAEFHTVGKVSRERTATEFIRRGQRAVDLLTWADKNIGAKANTLLEHIKPLLCFDQLCATHLDIKPDHVLIHSDRITFIDMDSSAMSDPAADVAMMCVRLDAMHPIEGVSLAVLEPAKRAFLDTYYEHLGSIDRPGLSAHMGLASLKVSLYFLQHLEPNWQSRVTSLLDDALKELTRK